MLKILPPRLTRTCLADHLALECPPSRQLILALRKIVLAAAPDAEEAIKFHCLCYYHPGVFLGSIGGNICMIEPRHRQAKGLALTFILGFDVPDPANLLRGTGKAKRFVPIPDMATVRDPRVAALVRASAEAAAESAG